MDKNYGKAENSMLRKIIKRMFQIFTAALAILILCYCYARYEFGNIKVKEIELASEDIPESFDGMRIMYAADFQFDARNSFNKKALNKAIRIMNSTDKDIILLGGDYTNWEGKIIPFFEEFKKVEKPHYGIYSVTGNHDYSNHTLVLEKLMENGIENLDNKKTEIKKDGQKIIIAGVDDLWFGEPYAEEVLKDTDKKDFVILLSHNPDYFEEIENNEKEKTDITLSGHIHAGQATFFGLFSPFTGSVTGYGEKYRYGMKNFDGHKIYITSGVGGSAFGQYIRFFARPEIIILKLKKI